MPDESAIAVAASELDTVIAHTLDALADRLLDRPAVGSPEWHQVLQHQQQHPEEGYAAERDWQLVKLRISAQAGIELATMVVVRPARWGRVAGHRRGLWAERPGRLPPLALTLLRYEAHEDVRTPPRRRPELRRSAPAAPLLASRHGRVRSGPDAALGRAPGLALDRRPGVSARRDRRGTGRVRR